MHIKKIIIVLMLLSGVINSTYAYYSKEHKFYADFPSEPRIKCFEYTQEKTAVKVTSYQSVDKTGIYTVTVSQI